MSKRPIPNYDRIADAMSNVGLPSLQQMIPPAAPPEPVDIWQIVVVGTIDARQHHPQWYRMIGCIDDGELKAALSTLAMGVIPTSPGMPVQVSVCQFAVRSIILIVQPDRWVIQTFDKDQCNRIIEVASLVFRTLNEIGIVAYGINKLWGLKLGRLSARRFLTDKLAAADLALPTGDTEATITYAQHSPDFSDTVIQLSPLAGNEQWLTIAYNRNHSVAEKNKKAGVTGYFDLGKMILDDAQSDWQVASDYGSALAQCVKRSEG